MRRTLAAVLAVAAAVGLLGLALGWWQGSSHRPPARLFQANASLSTRSVSFGDPLGARLDLLVDPTAIDVDSVRVRAAFAPYRVAGTTTRRSRGDGVLLSYRWSLDCLEQGCLPQGAVSEKRFRPANVSFRTLDGSPGLTQVSWPAYRVASWLHGSEVDAPAQHLRFDVSVPPPTYRIDPGTLRALLAALCALLVLGAAAFLWLGLGRERGRGPVLSGLERALAAVRASSANGHVAERRKALGWLGRELGAVEQPDLARGASRLAWSRRAPSGEAAGAFADDVEGRP